MYSPQFKSLSDWFSYAFKNSDLDQVDRFPVIGNVEHKNPSRDKGRSFGFTYTYLLLGFSY